MTILITDDLDTFNTILNNKETIKLKSEVSQKEVLDIILSTEFEKKIVGLFKHNRTKEFVEKVLDMPLYSYLESQNMKRGDSLFFVMDSKDGLVWTQIKIL